MLDAAEIPVTESDSLAAQQQTNLDACPESRRANGRISAVCTSLSIMGRTAGIIHATGRPDVPVEDDAGSGTGPPPTSVPTSSNREGIVLRRTFLSWAPLVFIAGSKKRPQPAPGIYADNYSDVY